MNLDVGMTGLIALPLGLGLIGFIEPCSIGSTLLMVKFLEGKPAAAKLSAVTIFALTRAVFIGTLGMLAAFAGSAFLGFQKAAWIVLGGLYVLLGLMFLLRREGALMTTIGTRMSVISGSGRALGLGVLFGFNIPACAAPLLFALFGWVAAHGASGATLAQGFVALAMFGLGLSLPLVIAVLIPRARQGLDWLANLSGRMPVVTGILILALGAWSIWTGLFLTVKA